ncbi:hypothetical protein PSACC_01285 [Paramicrosporidium saccamoebae]|uniref:RNA helicase n=1 Tax=Paramicrosporidium saccamoebae TaxID=1246581 RepID=A0A2H9TM93_9FUNG|nr:hypothetical protein PSACC_01285 [Paramicrosporidium saccamoebae]
MTVEDIIDFSSFELDARLTRILLRNNITKPTLIQEKAIPLALAGKDLLAKAKTGSGKTLAYLLPILQRLLTVSKAGVRTLILVPTKELARQVAETTTSYLHYAPKELCCLNLAGEESLQLQKSMLAVHPSVLISTPSRLLPHLDSKALLLDSLDFFVVDEADLVLSFGYTQDLERIVQEFLPKTVQTFLMSATLTGEMEKLKSLVMRNPVILKLQEAEEEDQNLLQQYVIRCEQEDKFILMYVVLKLKLLKGKLLVFANDVERCFRLKLFLEQFGIKTCLLNPELPLQSRHHIVDEFNRGVYDIIIASDTESSAVVPKKGKKHGKTDKEGGVARGVDFRHVDVVVNFDLPQRVDSYVHRVGRTARGGNTGTALSFVSSTCDETILRAIGADQEQRGSQIIPHEFDLKQIDGFRYRCSDALRAVTKVAIHTARLQAAKDEIVKSEKLKTFFEERPKDLGLLRHDNSSGVIKARPHLKHVPEYLLASEDADKRAKLDPLPQAERNPKQQKSRRGKSFIKKRRDPLKSIKKK